MVDKSKLPSRHVSLGPESAPHRSYYYAMGMTESEINQPYLYVVIVPYHLIKLKFLLKIKKSKF